MNLLLLAFFALSPAFANETPVEVLALVKDYNDLAGRQTELHEAETHKTMSATKIAALFRGEILNKVETDLAKFEGLKYDDLETAKDVADLREGFEADRDYFEAEARFLDKPTKSNFAAVKLKNDRWFKALNKIAANERLIQEGPGELEIATSLKQWADKFRKDSKEAYSVIARYELKKSKPSRKKLAKLHTKIAVDHARCLELKGRGDADKDFRASLCNESLFLGQSLDYLDEILTGKDRHTEFLERVYLTLNEKADSTAQLGRKRTPASVATSEKQADFFSNVILFNESIAQIDQNSDDQKKIARVFFASYGVQRIGENLGKGDLWQNMARKNFLKSIDCQREALGQMQSYLQTHKSKYLRKFKIAVKEAEEFYRRGHKPLVKNGIKPFVDEALKAT